MQNDFCADDLFSHNCLLPRNNNTWTHLCKYTFQNYCLIQVTWLLSKQMSVYTEHYRNNRHKRGAMRRKRSKTFQTSDKNRAVSRQHSTLSFKPWEENVCNIACVLPHLQSIHYLPRFILPKRIFSSHHLSSFWLLDIPVSFGGAMGASCPNSNWPWCVSEMTLHSITAS